MVDPGGAEEVATTRTGDSSAVGGVSGPRSVSLFGIGDGVIVGVTTAVGVGVSDGASVGDDVGVEVGGGTGVEPDAGFGDGVRGAKVGFSVGVGGGGVFCASTGNTGTPNNETRTAVVAHHDADKSATS